MPDAVLTLRRLSVNDERDVNDFLQNLPEGNGFTNDAYSIPFEAFMGMPPRCCAWHLPKQLL